MARTNGLQFSRWLESRTYVFIFSRFPKMRSFLLLGRLMSSVDCFKVAKAGSTGIRMGMQRQAEPENIGIYGISLLGA